MEPLGHHIVLRLRDNRVIARNPGWRRRVAKALLDRGPRYHLVAFRLADTHLHAMVLCDAREAAQLARRAEISISLRRPHVPGFARVWVKPIESQAHLRNLFSYIHGQEPHHGTNADPFHDGGNLPDLLGLRVTGAYTRTLVREVLPRVARADLLAALGVEDLVLANGPIHLLADAAAAAVAVPKLGARIPESQAATCAAVHIAGDRIRNKDLAALLNTSPRSISRYRAETPDPSILRAIRLQLDFRAQRPTSRR